MGKAFLLSDVTRSLKGGPILSLEEEPGVSFLGWDKRKSRYGPLIADDLLCLSVSCLPPKQPAGRCSII